MKEMIRKRIESERLSITILLSLLTLFSVSLTVFRIFYSGSLEFISLNWNLFLAFIPWLLSSVIILGNLKNNKILLSLLMLTWVLFFPNSPYILTDLFHLYPRYGVPLWFDLVLILSFAFTGLLFGFISLLDIEKILSGFLSKGKVVFLTITYLFLSGFGIYLGRFLRWNSWDVVTSPIPLFSDITHRFINPFAYPKAWALTILIGILLNLLYFSFRFIKVPKE
jgi:uncharacterized membrane protein